jgi:hypothetical protein
MVYPKNIHPRQRQPKPSQIGKNRAIQPYKPKTLRDAWSGFKLTGDVFEPDLVRFKGQTIEWTVHRVSNSLIWLMRKDNRGKTCRKVISRHDQYRLEIIFQPPRDTSKRSRAKSSTSKAA